MSEIKNVAIVLGGGIAHLPLISKLKGRGYFIVLVDYLENPPARLLVDLHERVSTLDKQEVLQLAKKYDTKLVITTNLDQPLQTACFVAEKLGLARPFSYDDSIKVTNKRLMKNLLSQNNIDTAKYFVVNQHDGLLDNLNLNFPLVIKPADGTGSLGVNIARTKSDLKSNIDQALQNSLDKEVIIEEFRQGEEWNVYGFIENYEPTIFMILEKYKYSDCYDDSVTMPGLTQLGTITKKSILPSVREKIHSIVRKIAKSFGIKNSPILLQMIVNGTDVSIIEFAARLGGTGSTNYLIEEYSGVDIVNLAIDSYLGGINVASRKESDYFYAISFVYAKSGVYKQVLGLSDALQEKLIEKYEETKTSNSIINDPFSSRNRVAYFIVKGSNENELYSKIRKVFDQVDVLDESGGSIMYKNTYIRQKLN